MCVCVCLCVPYVISTQPGSAQETHSRAGCLKDYPCLPTNVASQAWLPWLFPNSNIKIKTS